MQITLAMYADGAAPTLCKIAKFQPLEIAAETVLISHSITMRCDLTHIQSTIQTHHHHQRFELFLYVYSVTLSRYLFKNEFSIHFRMMHHGIKGSKKKIGYGSILNSLYF